MITAKPLTERMRARPGVDDFLARHPETNGVDQSEQASGRLVAMTGDGKTTRRRSRKRRRRGDEQRASSQEAAQWSTSIPIRRTDRGRRGRQQLLMTRGALTTFSIATT